MKKSLQQLIDLYQTGEATEAERRALCFSICYISSKTTRGASEARKAFNRIQQIIEHEEYLEVSFDTACPYFSRFYFDLDYLKVEYHTFQDYTGEFRKIKKALLKSHPYIVS